MKKLVGRESAIQKKIKANLEKEGWLVIKLIQTTMNGIPDLLLLREGRTVFIEVKHPGNHSTPLQEYIQEKLRSRGVEVYETCNPDFHL
jgi:Holliday junction resolvase